MDQTKLMATFISPFFPRFHFKSFLAPRLMSSFGQTKTVVAGGACVDFKRERERERLCECMCYRQSKRKSVCVYVFVCVCVCVKEKERERESER